MHHEQLLRTLPQEQVNEITAMCPYMTKKRYKEGRMAETESEEKVCLIMFACNYSIGLALIDSLDELIQSGHINPQLAMRVLAQVPYPTPFPVVA